MGQSLQVLDFRQVLDVVFAKVQLDQFLAVREILQTLNLVQREGKDLNIGKRGCNDTHVIKVISPQVNILDSMK